MSARILVVNPNSSAACTAGIAAALAPLAGHGAVFETVSLPEGPPAIASWRDWFGVSEPLCRLVARHPADATIIACVSDPGVDAVREVTTRPVFGVLRCAVAAALARADRFGMLGFLPSSRARQDRVLDSMGVASRLVAWRSLDLPMEVLTDPAAPRARIAAVARALAADGAPIIVLGCTGMAGHVACAEDAAGVPVIEPCRAAAVQALLAVAHGAGLSRADKRAV